jgi:hypothetical protein
MGRRSRPRRFDTMIPSRQLQANDQGGTFYTSLQPLYQQRWMICFWRVQGRFLHMAHSSKRFHCLTVAFIALHFYTRKRLGKCIKRLAQKAESILSSFCVTSFKLITKHVYFVPTLMWCHDTSCNPRALKAESYRLCLYYSSSYRSL